MFITIEVAKIPGTTTTGEHTPFINAYCFYLPFRFYFPPKHTFFN